MQVKQRLREGWIMLLRSFKFAELKKPLHKMTILYAYSEKPIISYEYTKEGKRLLDEAYENMYKPFTPTTTPAQRKWRRSFNESEGNTFYNKRIEYELESLEKKYKIIEIYEGQIVQCEVEGTMCRFFPDEYNVIQQDTFEHVMTTPDYIMEIENKTIFELPEIKEKLLYIRSRGIGKDIAERMASANAKENVIFRPGPGILQMFCRDWEIYK